MCEIVIEGQYWVGNIEIHVNCSDWFVHSHHKDAAFDHILLHVVFNNDVELNGFPTLVLNSFISEDQIDELETIIDSRSSREVIYSDLFRYTEFTPNWEDALIFKRLNRKSQEIQRELIRYKNDWEQVFYISLARNFGFRINALPFEWMARRTQLSVVRRFSGNIQRLESLFYGQAGMLQKFQSKDNRMKSYSEEYKLLSLCYNLKPIEPSAWKFMRMRPSNFPTIRISQFSSIMARSGSLVSEILSIDQKDQLIQIFRTSASQYWDRHYSFSKPSPLQTKNLGLSSIHNILINTVVPFLYTYGKKKGQPSYRKSALDLLNQIPPETNKVSNKFQKLGLGVDNAVKSQALLELYSTTQNVNLFNFHLENNSNENSRALAGIV